MRTNKILLFLLFVCGFTNFILAQNITGEVIDKSTNETIPGANIYVVGKVNHGTTTDMDGKFTLDGVVLGKDRINVSFIGYKTIIIPISAERTYYKIELESESTMLDDVVVIGYGTQKRSDLTGSISSVKASDLMKAPVVSAEQAMQGRLPGVYVASNSGSPGSSSYVRIRGIGTINDSSPLYVIDGVPSNDMSFINPADIESIDVLKDASSTAIYGARAANGVIMVTTKKGKAGVAKVNFDAYVGISNVWKKPKLLKAQEWYDIVNEARLNHDKFYPNNTPLGKLKLAYPSDDLKRTTNWFDEITQTGVSQNYNLSIIGGTDVARYTVSGGYLKDEGTIKGSDFTRFTVRFSGDYNVKPWLKVGSNTSIIYSIKNSVNENDQYYGLIYSALKMDPATPVWDNKKNYYATSPYMDIFTPTAYNATHTNKYNTFKIFGNVYTDITLYKDFTFRSVFGLDATNKRQSGYETTYHFSEQLRNDQAEVIRNTVQPISWLWDNTLTYNKIFDEKHNFSAMIGTSAQEEKDETINVSGFKTPNNSKNLQELESTETQKASGKVREWSLFSVFGRVNYSYDSKYLLTINFRRDGSSKFGSNHKYGNFPSFSTGWVINKENFMQNIKFINNLKLRAGWGKIGNDKITSYGYESYITADRQLSYVFGPDQKVSYGATSIILGNSNLKWETTTSVNVGIDFAFLNNRFSGSFDYFNRKTTDMLIPLPIPNYVGWGMGGTPPRPWVNAGKVTNKGWELSLSWQDNISDLSYRITTNFSYVKNKVDYLAQNNITGGTTKFGSTTRTEAGQPIGSFYGYVTDGIFQKEQEIKGTAQEGIAIPGDIRFKKLSPGSKLDDAVDRTFIGNPFPKLTYGINISLDYKGFDLSAFLQGVTGNKIFNAMKNDLFNDKGENWNRSQEILNRWREDKPSNKIPIMNAGSKNDNLRISDFYVEDGSYLRLKTLQLGYTLPNKLVSKMGLERLRLYITAYNLFTITDYSGLDPETAATSGLNTSTNILNSGVDFGAYPQPRTFNFGINLTF